MDRVDSGLISRVSVWRPGCPPENTTLPHASPEDGILWIELSCGPEETADCLRALEAPCPGLEQKMLHDLLTPDEQPEGIQYADGEIRLASAFRARASRPRRHNRRGTAQGIGVLVFEPLELLASDRWLVTCAHPSRTFRGAETVDEGEPIDTDALHRAVTKHWSRHDEVNAADLGVAVMYELSLSYRRTQRELTAWLEDWELSLYVDDELKNADELPELWGLMAVLRDWLNPLNPGGVRDDIEKAWLPASDHTAVKNLDDRIDKTLAGLSRLSDTLRQSFGLLHLEQAEAQRQHSERQQHRIEIAAAVFLVPTLIVGFYGANTWVPGQGRHWGFWVMVVVLVMLSAGALLAVLHMQRRAEAGAFRAEAQRDRLRAEAITDARSTPP